MGGKSSNHGHSHGQHGHSHHNHGHSHGNGKWEVDWEGWDKKPEMIQSADRMADHIEANCAIHEQATALDFGCGTGLLLRKLIEKGKIVSGVGVDVEKEMLKVFNKRAEEEGMSEKLKSSLLTATDGREVPQKGKKHVYRKHMLQQGAQIFLSQAPLTSFLPCSFWAIF